MHIILVKTVPTHAQQARLTYKYHNINQKLQRANASIWFNKVCRAEQLQPIYINIRVNGDNRRNHQTKLAAVKYRINLELKYKCMCWYSVY
jgi:hypothetical protein